jgi:hypothetical protein
MSNTGTVDYEALAKQFGATSSTPQSGAVDYDALAKEHGAISSTKYHGAVPKEQLDQIQRLNANPTQFEKDRNPANQPGVVASVANEFGNAVKGGAKMMAGAFSPTAEGMSDAIGNTLAIPAQDAQRKESGRSVPYRAAAAVASVVPATNVAESEKQADVGNWRGVAGTAIGDAAMATAPVIGESAVKKFGPAVEKFSNSAVDKFQGAGVQKAVIPEASSLPAKAISGAEDIFRAAAPTGKNAGFRENVMVAAPDLADVARKVNIAEAKGGIINPDMRVRATVDALDSHLNEMYQTERAPQIQAHADVPVKVGTSPDSIRALEYLENTASTEEIRNLATKALGVQGESGVRFAAKPLTLAEADKLAVSANEYLKSFERAPGDVKMQIQQTSPKVAGLKSLDVELGRSINDALTSNGEIGIRDYERRFAAVSEVRNQLRDRINATELTRSVSFPGSELIKGAIKGKSGIASASQAAVADVNVGRKIQTGMQKLRESGISAKGSKPPSTK